MNPIWQKYDGSGVAWDFSDIKDWNALYEVFSKSYTGSEVGTSIPKYDLKQYARNWNFYGNADKSGFVCLKPCDKYNMFNLQKITAIAGDIKGIMQGMALVQKLECGLFSAVTPRLHEFCIKSGRGYFIKPKPAMIKNLIHKVPDGFWGRAGTPTVKRNGMLAFAYNEGVVEKNILVNKQFMDLVKLFTANA